MSIFLKHAKRLKAEQIIVDVWRDNLDDESLTGVIADYNDEYVLMSVFDESGEANGISIIERDDITRMRWDGAEQRAVRRLADAKSQKALGTTLPLKSLRTIIEAVQEKFGYVSVLTERSDSGAYVGELIEIDTQQLVLREYGSARSPERAQLLLSLDEITRVDAESGYEKDLRALAKANEAG